MNNVFDITEDQWEVQSIFTERSHLLPRAGASSGARQLWSRALCWGSGKPLTDVQPAQSKRSKREGGKTAAKSKSLEVVTIYAAN